MNRYNHLLDKIAMKYHISKGDEEKESQWMERIIYSICGMMAYASLWERTEEDVSIIHLKKRVRETLSNYDYLYHDIVSAFLHDFKEIEDEIYDIFLRAGIVYHNPYRLIPSMKREEAAGNIVFQRGISLDAISHVSGIGFYTKQESYTDLSTVIDLYGLESRNLQEVWEDVLSKAVWKEDPTLKSNTEFLRMKPPFTKRYWVLSPDKTGAVSILRTNQDESSRRYYLYYYDNDMLKVSLLPDWQVQNFHYRQLSCACLSMRATLPPIEYYEDGPLVHIRMNYLLPPRELEFLKLYSWPEKFYAFPHNFERKLSADVFSIIKSILEKQGYTFKGVSKSDAKWCEFSSQTIKEGFGRLH